MNTLQVKTQNAKYEYNENTGRFGIGESFGAANDNGSGIVQMRHRSLRNDRRRRTGGFARSRIIIDDEDSSGRFGIEESSLTLGIESDGS